MSVADRMRFDPADVRNLLKAASDDIIMPKFGRLNDDEVRTKSSPSDFVTEVDVAVEAFLQEQLRALAPDASFIGEEAAAEDPGIVKALEGAGRFWVLDPLDGTRNFVQGRREFATILAYVEDGETRAGWIYACPEDVCASVVAGTPPVIGDAPVAGPQGAADPPRGLRSVGWLTSEWREIIVGNLRSRLQSESGHCSAYAYLRLLRGEADFCISSRIHAWDHAAGALMAREAGGRVAYLDVPEETADYAPADSADRPLLAVGPGRDWAAVAAALIR